MQNRLKILKKAAIIIVVILAGIFFYLFANVMLRSGSYEPVESDAALILGHSLNQEGRPGEWLSERLREGQRLYEEGYCGKIIVSGGEGPSDHIAVSLAMKEWLMENGVSGDDIIIEDQAANTYENFKYTAEIALKENIESIIVVTNDFHIYRAMEIGKGFFHEISGASAEAGSGLRKTLAYLKEPFSLIKYYLTGWEW